MKQPSTGARVLKSAGAVAVGFSAIAQAAAGRAQIRQCRRGLAFAHVPHRHHQELRQGQRAGRHLRRQPRANGRRARIHRPQRRQGAEEVPGGRLRQDAQGDRSRTASIVTCPDAFHDEYIVRALDAGCDCITEKPLTTTPEKAQRILDACKRNNRHVRVLFNYRYSPPRTQVKDLLMSGEIGDVLSVDFHWLLNTLHGADYFRRWHSQKEISGGLMIHKATHHFDLVNWWLGSEPGDRAGRRQARVLHAEDGAAHGPAEPPRALPHLPREGQVRLLPRPRAPTRTSRSCTSTTRSTTAISATAACCARTSTSRTR